MFSGTIAAFDKIINIGNKPEIIMQGILTKNNSEKFTLNFHDSMNRIAI